MNKTNWHQLCITDKSGGEYFKTNASPLSTMSELKNLQRHLEQAAKYPHLYSFIDLKTAVILLDGEKFETTLSAADNELLDQLFTN